MTTSRMEDVHQIRRYLQEEVFPVGSFDSNVGSDIVTSIKRFANAGTLEGVAVAFELLDRLSEEALYDSSERKDEEENGTWNRDSFLSSDLLHRVTKAWRLSSKYKTTDLTPRVTFEKLKRWESCLPDLQDNVVLYTIIINAAATAKEPELAEEILSYVLDSKRSYANVVTFSSVIDAWAKSGQVDAPLQAEAVLNKMIDLSDSGWYEVTPNVISYSSVISAWANSNQNEAPYRAEELLREMQSRGLNPNIFSYSSVITAWSRSKNQSSDRGERSDGAIKAQAVFDDLLALHQRGEERLKPNVLTCTILIDAWAKAGEPEKAEHIIYVMHSIGVKPNLVTYNSVMNAWSKSNLPDAAIRVQRLFDELLQRYDSGERFMKPNLPTFGTLITAWGRSKDGAANAQAVFDNMLAQYQSGDVDLKPNVLICTSLIDAWAKAGSPARAEKILREMNLNEWPGVMPNVMTYGAVMNAWSRSNSPQAAEKTQALMDELIQRFNDGCEQMKPNLHTYGTLITALGRNKSKESAAKAQLIFDAIICRYRAGEEDLKPNAVLCNSLIDAWAKATAPEKAEEILRAMMCRTETIGVQPDIISFNAVMSGWSRSDHPFAVDRMQALYDEMIRNSQAGKRGIKPDKITFDLLLSAWCRNRTEDGVLKAHLVFGDLLVRFRAGEGELKPLVDNYSLKLSGMVARAP